MKPFIAKLFSMNLSFFILLSYLTFNSQAFSEETRYIRDTLFVPLRSGQSFKHRIVHKGLVSGTPLTIIGLNEDETYSHVRTRQGIEGWIQTQYLSNEPSARNQLASITAQNTQLKAQKSTLAQEFSALKKQHDDAQAQIKKLTQINLKRQKELSDIKDISANAITANPRTSKQSGLTTNR